MVMSTLLSNQAADLMSVAILTDSIDIYTAAEAKTTGFSVERALTPYAVGYPALVQTTVLENAIESAVTNTYSIKVGQGYALEPGMVIDVKTCVLEPDLVGKKLLVDKVSQNGAAIIRKAVAQDFTLVSQQGKTSLEVSNA